MQKYQLDNDLMNECVSQFDRTICDKVNKAGLVIFYQEMCQEFVSKKDMDKYKKQQENQEHSKSGELNRVR